MGIFVNFIINLIDKFAVITRFMSSKASISVKDIESLTFIKSYASYLKKQGKIKIPDFYDYVKTATFKKHSPSNQDWWYERVAAIARKIYLYQGLGVDRLREIYGGSQSNGSRPNKHFRASGNIIRKCLQQLEKNGVVELTASGGRKVTDSGRRDLDLIAGRCFIQTAKPSNLS